MLIVKRLRLKRGWSQAELAQFSGLSVRTIQRIEKGEKPGLETLKSLAAVFDLEAADLQNEEGSMEGTGVSTEERRAFEYVQGIKEFYLHLIMYVLVISGLFVLNILQTPGYIWAKWPAMGWGIGLLSHWVHAFHIFTLFGPEWEKRKVEKRLGRPL